MSSRSSEAYCCCIECGPAHFSSRGSWKVSTSFRRRSMDSMRSAVSWSNFDGTGGIVCARVQQKVWGQGGGGGGRSRGCYIAVTRGRRLMVDRGQNACRTRRPGVVQQLPPSNSVSFSNSFLIFLVSRTPCSIDICRSVRQMPIWLLHGRHGRERDHCHGFPSPEVFHRLSLGTKYRPWTRN